MVWWFVFRCGDLRSGGVWQSRWRMLRIVKVSLCVVWQSRQDQVRQGMFCCGGVRFGSYGKSCFGRHGTLRPDMAVMVS